MVRQRRRERYDIKDLHEDLYDTIRYCLRLAELMTQDVENDMPWEIIYDGIVVRVDNEGIQRLDDATPYHQIPAEAVELIKQMKGTDDE